MVQFRVHLDPGDPLRSSFTGFSSNDAYKFTRYGNRPRGVFINLAPFL